MYFKKDFKTIHNVDRVPEENFNFDMGCKPSNNPNSIHNMVNIQNVSFSFLRILISFIDIKYLKYFDEIALA